MKKLRTHAHKVQRINLSTTGEYLVYKCRLSGCTSYYALPVVVGMNTVCWNCLQEFTFTGRNLRQVKPKCIECSGGKVKISAEAAESVTSQPEQEFVDDIMQRLGLK